MNDNSTRLAALIRDAEDLATHGGTLPDEWHTIRERWADYVDRQPTPVDDLATAILTGQHDDLDRLTLAAYGHRTATPQVTAPLREELAGHVLDALTDAYATVAADNYATAARAYTAAGKRYSKAVSTVDPDASPSTLLDTTAATRSAWAEVEPLAVELDTLLERVKVAARLAHPGQIDTPHLIALAVTPRPKEDRRALWAAWEGGTEDAPRGGKWTRLARNGTPIAAPTRLEDWQPYRRPEPIHRQSIPSQPRARDFVTIEWDTELGETFEQKRDETWASIAQQRQQQRRPKRAHAS